MINADCAVVEVDVFNMVVRNSYLGQTIGVGQSGIANTEKVRITAVEITASYLDRTRTKVADIVFTSDTRSCSKFAILNDRTGYAAIDFDFIVAASVSRSAATRI